MLRTSRAIATRAASTAPGSRRRTGTSASIQARPGSADVAIQMHVLLLLAEIDHDAAVPLCQALARHVSDDSLWVYYARAPIVPLLRITDLRRIGCGLELPSQRLAGVPGQEVWIGRHATSRPFRAERARRSLESGASSRAGASRCARSRRLRRAATHAAAPLPQ
jgi:hypothetical protein